jgi:hypothetical protein
MDRSGHAQRMRGRGAAASARASTAAASWVFRSLGRRYLAFPNILHPHGQRSNALEHAGRLAKIPRRAAEPGTRRRRPGSHAGSHPAERLCGFPDSHERRAGKCPRSRTDLNGSGCPDMELRIRRSSGRPESARVLAGLRSGDGPLSVRVRPSSLMGPAGLTARARPKARPETRAANLPPASMS